MKYFRFLFLVCGLVGQAQNFKTYEQTCADGKTRPYVVYAPKEATSAKIRSAIAFCWLSRQRRLLFALSVWAKRLHLV